MAVSISTRSSSRAILTFAALFGLYTHAATTDRRPDAYLARAKDFIRTFYPGLDEALTPVITDRVGLKGLDAMNFFGIEFCDLEPKLNESPAECWCSDPALLADFVFDWQTESKELVRMDANGAVAEGRTHKFAEEMNKHREWSDTQVIAALNAAGAKFGPGHKAEFLRAFPVEQLKPFVGGELEVVSAEFYVRPSNPETRRSEIHPFWHVEAKWHGSEGREALCILIFEPFDGRLQSFQALRGLKSTGTTGGDLRVGAGREASHVPEPQRTQSK